jgi:hypothetical protein
VVRRKLTWCRRSRWSGDSTEKVEEICWDTVTQATAELAGVPRNSFRYLCGKWNEIDMTVRYAAVVRHHQMHGPTRFRTARPPRCEAARGTGLPQPHRFGRQPAVHRPTLADIEHGVRKASAGTPRDRRHNTKDDWDDGLTRTATGPKRASCQHRTDPLPRA